MHPSTARAIERYSSVTFSALEKLHSVAMGEFPKMADIASFSKF